MFTSVPSSNSYSFFMLPLLLDPHWPGGVAPDWVLSMGEIELFDTQTVLMLN